MSVVSNGLREDAPPLNRLSGRRSQCAGPRGGFTLIELLVVIAIISLLVSILVPSLRQAQELAKRSVCLVNQRSVVQGCLVYASESQGFIPPAQMALPGTGAFLLSHSYDATSTNYDPKKPLGVGLAIQAGLFPIDRLGDLMYCPSLNNLNTPYPGHCMDMDNNNWWGGIGASWWTTAPARRKRVIIGFNWRSASWYNQHTDSSGKHEQLRTDAIMPDTVLIVDALDPRFGFRYGHRDGCNRMFPDYHGGYFADPGRRIQTIQLAWGDPITMDGYYAGGAPDEEVFELLAGE